MVENSRRQNNLRCKPEPKQLLPWWPILSSLNAEFFEEQQFYHAQTTEVAMVKLKVVMEPREEGGYTVYVPSLPGCISEGETKAEALRNIREAIELYLESDESDVKQSKNHQIVEVTV